MFNPAKTVCMISGKNPFASMPSWNIDASCLNIEPTIKYLGTVLGNVRAKRHVEQRISAAYKAYYFTTGCRQKHCSAKYRLSHNQYISHYTIRLFECVNICMSYCTNDKTGLEGSRETLGKHVKCTIGGPSSCPTTPILQVDFTGSW